MDNVVVTVGKDVGKSCSSTSVVVDDCVEMIDENDYLGDAFKDGPQKFFLSDEWGSYLSHAGQKFESIADFRDKLRKFAIQSGFHYVLSRTDSIYVNAVCANRDVDHCGWEVLGSVASINQCFYITRFNNVHTCRGMIRNRSHRQLGSKIVRTCIESTVCLNLGLNPREIMGNFKSTYGYEISYKVASRAKIMCVEKMYGSECDFFSMLSWFREAVLETNLGSSVVFEVDESTERFKRVFVAYAGQIQGFKFSLPVLYVDGAFRKSKYKGQILATTGRNGNKCFFHLALCFCDSETEENWLFFFKNLKALLEPQGRIITFISDRGVGLWKAFDLIFPGCRYGIMANGIAESFNNWIVVERSLPPFAMLDQTRMKEMKMMSERSVESKSWTTKLTPKMEKRLKEQLDRSRVFRVIDSHENVYEVRNDKYSYLVDISTRICSCVKWQINCFSCAHALAVIQDARLDVYDFIDLYFTAEYYRMCYSFPIAPLSNVDASCSSTEDFILPPVTKRPAGRPKSKRIASAGEKKLTRCSCCNKMGHHNKKSCTEPLNMLL
ncbi:hypothetical protein ACLB2K_011814 [Fragaria x ananassa]